MPVGRELVTRLTCTAPVGAKEVEIDTRTRPTSGQVKNGRGCPCRSGVPGPICYGSRDVSSRDIGDS